jgi:hypothetical protein
VRCFTARSEGGGGAAERRVQNGGSTQAAANLLSRGAQAGRTRTDAMNEAGP